MSFTEKIPKFLRTLPLNSVNIAALALGFLQQLAVVRCHGTTAITDFYFLLIVVPQIIINLANSITGNALLPFLVQRRERLRGGDEIGLVKHLESRLRRIAVLAALLALLIAMIQSLFAPVWSAARFDVLMMLVAAPFLVAYGVITSLYTTAFRSRRQFWPPFTALLFAPGFGLALGVMLAPLGVWPFVAGQSLGMIFQYFWLRKRLGSRHGQMEDSGPALSRGEIGEIRGKIVTLLLIGIGFQCLPFVERTVAQKAGTGSVAAIALATRLGTSVSPITLSAATMMLFTTFAELAAGGNPQQAVAKLMQVLTILHWFLAGLVLAGPFVLAMVLPRILSQSQLVGSILHIFPDYLFGGCISAAGSLTTGCYYAISKDYKVQLYIIYSSLAAYALTISAPLWAHIAFDLRVISFANAIYCLLSVVSVTWYVAWSAGRRFSLGYITSLAGLVGAWIVVRGFF